MADKRLTEIRARLEAATPIRTRPVAAHLAALDLLNHAPEDIAYLLERVEKLEVENADLRRAVPLINDDGQTVWPSVHDNPTVLRAMLFDARARVERLEAVLEAARAVDAMHKGRQGPEIMRLRAAIEAAQ